MHKRTAIERAVVDELTKLSRTLNRLPAANGNWTRRVVSQLAVLAKKHGCHSCGHRCEHGEFLFDLVWIKGDLDGPKDAPLVVESEWGKDQHVEADFCKLLLARANTRLMIFDGENVRNVEELINRLRKNIRRFAKTQKGDRYLFAFWRDQRFQFDQFIA